MTKYCPACHVRLRDHHKNCPLCSAGLINKKPEGEIEIKTYPDRILDTDNDTQQASREYIFELWEAFSVLSLIAILIVFFIDVITHQAITWSRFSILSIAAGWAIITGLVFLIRHIWLLMIELSVVILLLLLLINYFVHWQLTWFVDLAMPITLLSIVSLSVCIIFSRYYKKNLLRLAFIIWIMSLYTVALDLIITFNNTLMMTKTWSIYVIIPSVLIAAFLLYIEYRFLRDPSRRSSLRAKFMM